MSAEESLRHLRIGAWASMCCEIDLAQVTTAKEVADIRADLLEQDDRERLGWMVWPTKEAALRDLR